MIGKQYNGCLVVENSRKNTTKNLKLYDMSALLVVKKIKLSETVV